MNPILVFHFEDAPPILQMMAYKPEGKKYIILVPTGITIGQQFERQLNIVKAQDVLNLLGVTTQSYAGQTTHCDGIHLYRLNFWTL